MRRKAEPGLTAACGASALSGRPQLGWGRSGDEPPGAERTGQGSLDEVEERPDYNQFKLKIYKIIIKCSLQFVTKGELYLIKT